MSTTLLLIDLSHLFWSAWFASVNDEVSTARNNTVNRVRGIVGRYPKVAICCDSAKSWRKDMAPTYKQNRPAKDPTAIEELRQVEELLRKDGNVLWKCETFEADDVIATATKHAVARDWDVVIFSADKDLCQLVGPKVRILSTRTGETMGADEVKAKHCVNPSQMLDYLALVGDTSDAIEGVKGVGPKTAAAMLEKFGSINGIYTALDDTPELFTKPALKAALLESNKIIEIAQKLIALRDDVPIRFEEIDEERKPEPLTKDEPVADLDHLDSIIEAEFGDLPDLVNKAKPVESESKEIARIQPENGLQPKSGQGALAMAQTLFNSRLYMRFGNPEAMFAVIVRGREMGLGALTSLDSFHVIDSKPVPSAHLIIARTMAHPDCEYIYCTETTDKQSTWVAKHRRNPTSTTLTYTIEQAAAVGFCDPPKAGKQPGQWLTRPAEMLRKTAGVQIARLVLPEAALGLYCTEELTEAA